jgi:hypothetical protein
MSALPVRRALRTIDFLLVSHAQPPDIFDTLAGHPCWLTV